MNQHRRTQKKLKLQELMSQEEVPPIHHERHPFVQNYKKEMYLLAIKMAIYSKLA